MIICDICNYEKPCERKSIIYDLSNGSFQKKEVDICRDCQRVLNSRKSLVEMAFIHNATEQEVLDSIGIEMPIHAER